MVDTVTNSVPPQQCCFVDLSGDSPSVIGQATISSGAGTFGGSESWKYFSIGHQYDPYWSTAYGVTCSCTDASPLKGYKAYDDSGTLKGTVSTTAIKIYDGSVSMNRARIWYLTNE